MPAGHRLSVFGPSGGRPACGGASDGTGALVSIRAATAAGGPANVAIAIVPDPTGCGDSAVSRRTGCVRAHAAPIKPPSTTPWAKTTHALGKAQRYCIVGWGEGRRAGVRNPGTPRRP